MPVVADADFALYVGDALDVLRALPDDSAQACVTSPPYLDARPEYPSPTLHEFEEIFRELARVVAGCCLVNVGRIFRGRVEVLWWVDLLRSAERAGWRLLDSLVWIKPNANPIHGEVFANSHEHVLVLGDPGDRLNVDAVRTPYSPESLARYTRKFAANAGVKGHNRPKHSRPQPGTENDLGARARSFVVAYTGSEKGNKHPAPMPVALAVYLVELASWPGDVVIDPFGGSGTTAVAARHLGRRSLLIELDESYAADCAERLSQQSLLAEEVA